MANPTIKKITELTAATSVAATDQYVIVDVDEPTASIRTKKLSANLVKLFNAAQITDGIIGNSKLATDSVTTSKIKALNVTSDKLASGAALANLAAKSITAAKIADKTITNSQLASGAALANIGTGNITNAYLANNAVTESKLGTIKRTVVIRVTGPLDSVEATNYGNFFAWPVSLNNFYVVDARINVSTVGASNTTVELRNQSGLMATLTLSAGQYGMSTSGTINASYRTAITNSFLGVNITTTSSAKGLTITLVLEGNPA